MQAVSQSWKDVHKQTLLNESYVEVFLDVADPDALADATAIDNGSTYISNTSEVTSEVDVSVIPYGTLEQNMWVLDGSRKHIPTTNYIGGGYIGDSLSNETGVFATKIPVITIEFKQVHSNLIPGVTITWGTVYNEFATRFVVTAYNGDEVVATKNIDDNKSVISVVALDIIDYDRITIEILGWCLPNRRARIDEIFVGWHKVYSKTDLMSYSHTQSVDPISTALPKMEIKFSIDNSDNSYNPYNLSGLAKYLTERQEVKTRYGLKLNDNTVEWIKGGTFYLSEWYAKQNGLTADFVARDLLEFMSAHYKDTISTPTSRSLYDLAVQVLESAGLPLNSDGTVKWVVHESLKSLSTTAPLPDDTIANCLQLIANAGCCVLYHDRDGILHIEPINANTTDYEVNSFNSYSKPEITLSKGIKNVVVKVYDYIENDSGIEGKVVSEEIVSFGDTGETITIDNPLIVRTNTIFTALAKRVGQWVGDYLQHRMTLDSSVRADVRIDALDIITNKHDYGTHTVRLTDVAFKFNGAFSGTSKGRVI